ncbi:MAG: hypothetical protein AAFW97_14625 [Pseudomonadota bacterium]
MTQQVLRRLSQTEANARLNNLMLVAAQQALEIARLRTILKKEQSE